MMSKEVMLNHSLSYDGHRKHKFVYRHTVYPETLQSMNFTSSANQLGCTDVPGLSVTWSVHQY